ncbi:MAG: helix-turn-helix domain-containing protein [Hyphomicrobium sp.]
MATAPSTSQEVCPSAAASGRVAFHTASDIDEQASLLNGWNQTYNQMSLGEFTGSLLNAEIGPVRLFREYTASSLDQTGQLPDDLYAFGVPLALYGAATFCGQPCDGSQLHMFSGRDRFQFHSPRGLTMAGIVLPRALLERKLFGEELEIRFSLHNLPALRTVEARHLAMLRHLLLDAFTQLAQDDDQTDGRLAPLTETLLSALATALTSTPGQTSPAIPAARASRLVRDAREIVRDAPDRRVRVDELCEELGVSRRALQYSFEQMLGMSPAMYLRAIRLNGARRAIKAGESVTSAATEWGFWHFGRFAHDYRYMFGELPSETCRRYHGTMPCRHDSARAAVPPAGAYASARRKPVVANEKEDP